MKSWTVTGACGGRYPAADPVFFKDGQRVCVATALGVKIYQLSTKQMIAKINTDCSTCTQLLLDSEEEYFYIVHSSGDVERVRVNDNNVEKLEHGNLKVHTLLNQVLESTISFMAIIVNIQGFLELGVLDLATGEYKSVLETGMHLDTGLTAVSGSGKFVSFGSTKSSKVELYNLEQQKSIKLKSAGRSSASRLAVSDSGLVAVGTASGVIDVIYPEKGWIRSLKWHLEPIQALRFTLNDEYLLSGGHERVLVFWQLSTNEQQFLPRLQGEITSICTSTGANSLYGITLANAQLVVLSAVDLLSRLNIAGTRAEYVKLPPEPQVARRKRRKRVLDAWANSDYTTSLEVQPGTRNVFLRASSSQTQVYNLSRDEQEQIINLAPTLDTGKVRRELEIEDPDVSLLKFTPDGEYMVTFDSSKTPPGLLSSNDLNTNLKFWTHADGKWTLNTRIESPHGSGVVIRDICFVKNDDRISVVTAATDGSLKLWESLDESVNGSFALKRTLPSFATNSKATSITASTDGSVLALGHESNIYLLNASTLRIAHQLPNIAGSSIRSLRFCGPNLVVLTKTRLVVFDLVSMSERWSIMVKSPHHGGRLLSIDETKNAIVFAVNFWEGYRVKSIILQFNPDTSVPEEIYIHPYAVGAITSIPGSGSFCFIDTRGVLNTLAGSVLQAQPQMSLTATLSTLYAQQTEDDLMEMEVDGKQSLDVNAVSKVFETGTSLDDLFEKVLKLVS